MPGRSTAALLIVRHYGPGGREHGGGIGRLIGYLVDAANDAGDAHAVCDTRGPRWTPVPSALRLSAAVLTMTLDRFSAPARIHHIHIAGRGSTYRKLLLASVARGLGCRHVIHLHDYDYECDYRRRSPWLQARVRQAFRGADLVIVLGQRDRRTVEDVLGVDPGRVAVIHNAVPDPGSPPERPGNGVTVLFLGQLSERKGVPELLRALASPRMAALEWRAVLAGDGPVSDYRRQADALGIAGRVDFAGWLGEAEVTELCRTSDILVLPSHAEGLAMSVLEGLAHGMAVITTRVGAHEEAISDGESGVFVPPGDVPALAAALERLVSDAALRSRLSGGARARYLSQFSVGRYARTLERHYSGIRGPGAVVAAVK